MAVKKYDLGSVMGPKGATGTRGSAWYSGTAITGTATTGTIFANSGIAAALVNDMYLNTSTGAVYKCVTAGAASAAKWAYVGSIKGPTGKTGATGPTGAVNADTKIAFTAATSRGNIVSGDSIKTIFGKLTKWYADFKAAFATIVNNGTTTASGTVLDGRMGKTLMDKINQLDNNLGTNLDKLLLRHRTITDFNNVPDGACVFDATKDIANSPGIRGGYLYQQTCAIGNYTMKYQIILSNNGVAHYTRVCWYNNWTEWHNFNRASLMQKDIRAKAGRTEQRYGNLSVVTTNGQGENAVSGFTNCLCIHMAVDIRDAQQYFLFSVGFVMNNQYYGSVISSKGNLTMATNTVGTVAIQGGAAEFVKQTFIFVPQVDYSVKN